MKRIAVFEFSMVYAVQIVSRELVRPLHVRITNIAHALQQWGVGSAKLLARHDNYWDGGTDAGEAPVQGS
jgi:hypothetical protein